MQNHDYNELRNRKAPLEIQSDEFRQMGHLLVDQIAEFLDNLSGRPVTVDKSPQALRALLGNEDLPDKGISLSDLVEEVPDLLFDNSLFNGHPKFFGYISGAGAPIGILADMLAAAVNPNVGGAILSPIATQIEAQTIRWIAEFIGYPNDCGGVLVSGGNMANFTGFLAARNYKAPWLKNDDGKTDIHPQLVAYSSEETHTWIDKASELFGIGKNNVRLIKTNKNLEIDVNCLEEEIQKDIDAGNLPFIVIGTAGTTTSGAVDPLPQISTIAKKYDMWFHVDGAYGAPAAGLPDASPKLKALKEADSIALDPHKWLYSSLEAGCILVNDVRTLQETFSHNPSYYAFEEGVKLKLENEPNYHEYSLQNSRGFRALKVWLALRQAGKQGYIKMISTDIALSKAMYELLEKHADFETFTQNLSIATFRYVPTGMSKNDKTSDYLNRLNEVIHNRLQREGKYFLSNAVINGKFLLRTCIVNFRTSFEDIEEIPDFIAKVGREEVAKLRLV
jgi:aromatic-L-amino-acid/L-tryptophan decarboxylase